MARSIELLTALDKLAKTARTQYHYINSGGCCVFAVEVARWLETAGIPVWIVVASRDAEGNLRKIRQYVEDVGNAVEWNDNGVFFHHVGIKFEYKGKTYQYEAEYGVAAENFTLGDDIWYVYDGYLELEEAAALAENSWNWSGWFDRAKIPGLKKLVQDLLEPVVEHEMRLTLKAA